MVFAVGAGSRMVAVDRHSDFPPAVRTLPRVGTYIHPDVERVAALRPDLVLAVKDGTPPHLLARLRYLGIRVYVADPRTLEDVIATVAEVGHQVGAPEAAGELAADLRRRLTRIRTLAARARSQPRVFFQLGVAPIVSAGSRTLIDEMIATAGGRNVAADSANPYPRFSREQVLALRPEVILITTMERQGLFEQVRTGWERWPQLPAAREGRIHLINSDLVDRPGPRLFEGLEAVFRLLHPDLAVEVP
jgi:iron complex transport system substrate-binding protein